MQAYLEHFPASQSLVLHSEEVFAAPGAVIARLSDFLGIDAGLWPAFEAANVTAERVVAPALLRNLARFPRVKPAAKRAVRLLNRSPARGLMRPADAPAFPLGDALRADLARRFAEDQALLETLLADPARIEAPAI